MSEDFFRGLFKIAVGVIILALAEGMKSDLLTLASFYVIGSGAADLI